MDLPDIIYLIGIPITFIALILINRYHLYKFDNCIPLPLMGLMSLCSILLWVAAIVTFSTVYFTEGYKRLSKVKVFNKIESYCIAKDRTDKMKTGAKDF